MRLVSSLLVWMIVLAPGIGPARGQSVGPGARPPAVGKPAAARPKISGEIHAHRAAKQPPPGLAGANHESNLRSMGLRSEEPDREACALYVERPLTAPEIAGLRAQGVEVSETYIPPVPGRHPLGFYLATVRYDSLSVVEADARIVHLESTEFLHKPLNDLAGIQTNVDDVHLGTGLSQAYDGTGVKIAIADSGVDLTHADIPTPVEAYDVTDGVGLANWGTNVANTVTDHGTHVTGSALGSGGLSGGKYVGAAPGADFYFYKIGDDVTGSASEADEIEAIDRALAVGCDIFSMSYGGVSTYMDGSSAMSQAVDAAVAAGMTVFISAGNEATNDQHDSMDVAPGTTSAAFGYTTTLGALVNGAQINIRLMWRDGSAGDANITLACTNLGAGESVVQAFSGFSSRGTDAKRYVLITNQSAGASKTYNLTVQNTAVSGTTPKVHLYEITGGGKFDSPDGSYTIGNPALSDEAIAVGAWTQRKSWVSYQGGGFQYSDLTAGTLAPFSSRGPRIDDTMKPEVVAPGAATISSRDSVGSLAATSALIIDNDGLNQNGSGPANYYIKRGTSMACPYAAGLAALVLQAQPTLTPAQLRQALTETASQAGSPDNSVGYGLLNALLAVQEDFTTPEVDAILAQNAGPTNADAIVYDVTFTENVTGVTAGAFSVTTVSGDATGTVNASIGGSGSAYTVTVEGIVGDGELRLDLTTTTGIEDAAGNELAGGGIGETSAIDNTPPTVSIGSPSAAETGAGPVDWIVTYTGADAVNLTAGMVSLNSTGDAGGTITVLNGMTATPSVRVSGIVGDGMLGITIAGGTASDAVGNVDGGDGPSATVNVDNTPPTVSIGSSSAGETNVGPVDWIVNYSGANAVNLTAGMVTLHATGDAGGTITVLNGTTPTPTVRVSGIVGDGTLGITIAGGAASDLVGNMDSGDGPSATVDVDNTAPSVLIGSPSPGITGVGPVDWIVTYSGADEVDLTSGMVTLNATGDAGGTITVLNGTTATPTVRVAGIVGDGTLGISVAGGAASDVVGNMDGGDGPSATATIDNTPPTVSIGSPSAAETDVGPVDWIVTYSGASAVNLSAGMVTLNATGDAGGTIAVINGTSTTPTVRVSAVVGNGTLGITVAGGAAGDTVGNLDRGDGPSATAAVVNIPPVYANFAWSGTETGSQSQPFNTLAEALAATPSGGSIRISGGVSSETPRIVQQVRLETIGGLVRIGDIEGNGPAQNTAGTPRPEAGGGEGRSAASDWLLYE